ncbi:MAG: cold-shock protein [Firmicutes bacterium]|nr:cold-shock protein [Bacillota bacterium]
MKLGTIKWFNNEKGFGFIINDKNEDVFVHYSQIKCDGYKTLSEGDQVKYEEVETDKGLQAHNVEVVNQVVNQ